MSIIAKKANPAEIDTPSTGKVSLYVDCNDGKIKIKDDSGCVNSLMYVQSGTCFGVIDLLVVGGGAAGGGLGGGGAGGVIYCGNYILCTACHDISIGEGGVCANGGNTCFDNIIAYGGGRGASAAKTPGSDGGSGGGAGPASYYDGACGGKGCVGQGHDGGMTIGVGGCGSRRGNGGGGGGAGTQGQDKSNNSQHSKGGDGLPFDISGELCYYGAGGGGYVSCCSGGITEGGCGGGGCGYAHMGASGSNGSFYGAGGGGGNYCGYKGVVILRYKTDGSSGIGCATGGTITCCNGYTIHTFDNTTAAQTFCITNFSDFNPLV